MLYRIGILTVLLAIVFVSITRKITKESISAFDKIDAIDIVLLSTRVVTSKGDTLDIINTSFFNETVTLEDGSIHDYEYIKNKFLGKSSLKKIDSIRNLK